MNNVVFIFDIVIEILMFLCFDCIYRNVVWFVGVNKLIYFILWIWRFVVDIIEERLNLVIKDDIIVL